MPAYNSNPEDLDALENYNDWKMRMLLESGEAHPTDIVGEYGESLLQVCLRSWGNIKQGPNVEKRAKEVKPTL